MIRHTLRRPTRGRTFSRRRVRLMAITRGVTIVGTNGVRQPRPRTNRGGGMGNKIGHRVRSTQVRQHYLVTRVRRHDSNSSMRNNISGRRNRVSRRSPMRRITRLLLTSVSRLDNNPIATVNLSTTYEQLAIATRVQRLERRSFLFSHALRISQLSLL